MRIHTRETDQPVAHRAQLGDLIVGIDALAQCRSGIHRHHNRLVQARGVQFQVERFEGLKVIADIKCLARRVGQFRMARNHFPYQQGVRVKVDRKVRHT